MPRQSDDKYKAKREELFTLDSDQIDWLREGFELEQRELSPYATRDYQAVRERTSTYTKRAQHELETGQYFVRSPFLSDVDRVINSPFYRRTYDKTQVFSFYRNDDVTRRGFHIQLVAQIALKISRALRLNVPLTYAIGLGHDAGHTPFGHMGEKFLSEKYHEHTGRYFNHNVHSVRALRKVSQCDLSLQTYNGMLCHCGENNFAVYKPRECRSFEMLDLLMERCYTEEGYSSCLRPSTLEGCVVRISDILAYLGKDRQDALNAGVIEVGDYRYDSFLGSVNHEVIANVTTNIVKNSIDRDCICMDEEVCEEIKRLKKFNFESVYNYDASRGAKLKTYVRPMLHEMYERLLDDYRRGDESSPIFTGHLHAWYMNTRGTRYVESTSADDIVCDYIASMTDDYFIACYRHLFPDDPKSSVELYVPYF